MIKQVFSDVLAVHAIMVSRLKSLIHRSGKSASALSEEAGLERDAIRNILRGKSLQPKYTTIERIAAVTGVTPDYILGKVDIPLAAEAGPVGPTSSASLPLIGYIGAGDTVFHFGIGEAHEPIDAPPGVKRGVVAEVRGTSMAPVYRQGDMVVASEFDGPLEQLVGEDCFVQVQDGPLYLKILRRGQRGRFNLESYNSAVAPILNQPVEWAAPVVWVRRA